MQGSPRNRRGTAVVAVAVLVGLAVVPQPLPGYQTTSAQQGPAAWSPTSSLDLHLDLAGRAPDGLTAHATSTTTAPTTTEHDEPPPPEPEPPAQPEPVEPDPPQYESPPEPAPAPPEPVEDEWMAVFEEMASSLPGYYSVEDKGMWGATELSSGAVYIARRTPLVYLRSVMVHEAAHVLQGRRFGGYYEAQDALAPYGGIEVTADCKALQWGATWVHYGCTAAGQEGAALF